MTNHCKSVRETFVVCKGFKVYNFQKCLEYLENQGKTTYGRSFHISEMDYPTIYKLLIYMIKDEKSAMNQNIDLSKGILVSGSIGCGKTSLMNLVRPFAYHSSEYKIKTCREVSFEFAKNGFEAINCYTLKQASQSKLTGYCFDDLGAEQQIKHFGNDCNVMAEVLISRYEQFVENKSVTHITTNLSASEIENNYGNRLRSRMRQMFNLITFDSRTKDKR
ncbi:ATPase [Flavobacterium yafengii]|uniref:ATPase n=1 Tax=Flavobacterium yafengii TaxID=3041253 RepID=UPI0024A8A2F0|nr:ATPase [Flavobacterium yafengii]MDI6047035.1 ATPase [Flavobacterium yafengii]